MLILPYPTVPAPAHGDAYAMVAREARMTDFAVVEPLQAFEAEGLANVRFGPGDPVHPNAQGHGVIAEMLFEGYANTIP